MRLGLLLGAQTLGKGCTSCDVSAPYDPLSCLGVGKARISRHNMIKMALARVFTKLGAAVEVEQRIYGSNVDSSVSNPKKRPDITIFHGDLRAAIDVTVVNPFTRSASSTARSVLDAPSFGTLKKAEASKTGYYRDACDAHGLIFIPFVVGVDGNLGVGARDFIHTLASVIYRPEYDKAHTYSEIVSTVQDALADGNNRMMVAHQRSLFSI